MFFWTPARAFGAAALCAGALWFAFGRAGKQGPEPQEAKVGATVGRTPASPPRLQIAPSPATAPNDREDQLRPHPAAFATPQARPPGGAPADSQPGRGPQATPSRVLLPITPAVSAAVALTEYRRALCDCPHRACAEEVGMAWAGRVADSPYSAGQEDVIARERKEITHCLAIVNQRDAQLREGKGS